MTSLVWMSSASFPSMFSKNDLRIRDDIVLKIISHTTSRYLMLIVALIQSNQPQSSSISINEQMSHSTSCRIRHYLSSCWVRPTVHKALLPKWSALDHVLWNFTYDKVEPAVLMIQMITYLWMICHFQQTKCFYNGMLFLADDIWSRSSLT